MKWSDYMKVLVTGVKGQLGYDLSLIHIFIEEHSGSIWAETDGASKNKFIVQLNSVTD